MNEKTNIHRVLILLTRKCQLDCIYCEMKRDLPDMTKKDLLSAIEFLFKSKEKEIELQFFGGEPLLRFDLIKEGIMYSESLAKKTKKKIKYVITTNGLLIDNKKLEFLSKYDVKLMLSLDGKKEINEKNRKIIGKKEYFDTLLNNIKTIDKARQEFFINMVISPKNTKSILDNFRYLIDNNIKNIQIAYELGIEWKEKEKNNFFTEIDEIKDYVQKYNKDNTKKINFFNETPDEPIFASPVIVIDTDSSIYLGCSIVLEKKLPILQKSFYKGKVKEVDNIELLEKTREEMLFEIIEKKDLPEKERKIILNNLNMGIELNKKYDKKETAFLELQLTSKCQLDCVYCELDRKQKDMDLKTLYNSIDFLFTTKKDKIRLQFFGGEPLLRLDLIKKGIKYAERLNHNKNKELEFYISTNGLLLNEKMITFFSYHNIKFIFSLDGAKETQTSNRPLYKKGITYPYDTLINNLKKINELNFDFFINLVVRPENSRLIKNNIQFFIEKLNVKNILISYMLGHTWKEKEEKEFHMNLKESITLFRNTLNIMNLESEDEPTIATTSINIDSEGEIYMGCSLSMTKSLPSFKKINHVGSINSLKSFDDINLDKNSQIIKLLLSKYTTKEERERVANNIELGLKNKKIIRKSIKENKLLDSKSDVMNKLKFVHQNRNIASLMLMITYECQMICKYCKVEQKKDRIKEEVYKKAIKLLFTSESNDLLLRLWGGEPLLYPEIIFDIMEYAEDLKKKYHNKKIRYMITTNGLNITKEVIDNLKKMDIELMISIDGNNDTTKKNRKSISGKSIHETIISNIKKVQEAGIKYFVNMTVVPENINLLEENYTYLVNNGIKRIQIGYATGEIWEKEKCFSLLNKLSKIEITSRSKGIKLMNIDNDAEPVMLSDELIVDTNGTIYYDIAIFQEKIFPELKKTMCLSDIYKTKRLQDLFHSKTEIYLKIINTYNKHELNNDLINNNINLGLLIKETIENRFKKNIDKTENSKLMEFLEGTTTEQIQFKKKYSIDIKPYILRIANKCKNNCLFCKNKEIPKSCMDYIEYKIKDNLKNNLEEICIVGNEPLNHPKIIEIIDLCKKYGFKKFEMMTSGMFLSDPKYLKELYEKGVKSFSIPIYSLNSKKHDNIVGRKGDFNKLMKAISNLKKYKNIIIYIHTNLLKQNLNDIREIEEFVKKEITPNFCIIPTRCKASNLPYRELIPNYKKMIEEINTDSLIGFPLCVIEKIQKNKLISSERISNSLKIYVLDQNHIKLKKCKECVLQKKCLGTFREYVNIYGTKEIIPKNE